MTSTTAASLSNQSPRLPQFVTRRVERYEAETIHAEHTAHVLVGAVPLSAGDVDLDMMAHASLYQGVVAACADLRVFRHNDVDPLRRQVLTRGPGVIAIDSVYSTDGSLERIARACSKIRGSIGVAQWPSSRRSGRKTRVDKQPASAGQTFPGACRSADRVGWLNQSEARPPLA
ncbi:hypothetical protein [uncultured Thiodictyon sp.]|jgi:hypothetical protein|uniref:hypothetical protein n=1 Tax=uncultured Thiodictyon sp. TaxID=1846217 RepID=UPI0025F07CCA|nr:hypothetical protein [uncultured Thiodictyon sp.]